MLVCEVTEQEVNEFVSQANGSMSDFLNLLPANDIAYHKFNCSEAILRLGR